MKIGTYYVPKHVPYVRGVIPTRYGALLSLYLPVCNGGSTGRHGLRNGLVNWTKAHVNYFNVKRKNPSIVMVKITLVKYNN